MFWRLVKGSNGVVEGKKEREGEEDKREGKSWMTMTSKRMCWLPSGLARFPDD